MRHFTPILAAAALVLSTAAAQADLGDQLFKLLPDDGAADDRFGRSVAIRGTIAIVGVIWDDDNGEDSGSAYLFDTAAGQQIAKLLPDDGAADDRFGQSVAISGITAIVGALRDDDNGSDSGSAYLFDTTTVQQIAKLLADDGAADDRFGCSVEISGTTAIVGAYWDDDNGSASGSAYLFDTTSGEQIAKLLPNDGAAGAWFGSFVALSGGTAIVGAQADNSNGPNSGSAYMFDVAVNPVCSADLDGDSTVGAADLAILLGSWGPCPNPPDPCPADIFGTGDGFVSGDDLAQLLGSWGPCP